MIENRGLIFHVVQKEFWWFKNSVIEKDDLVHYGMLGLYNAVLKFKKEKKIKFSTYAYISIRNTIQRAIENDGYRACRIPSYLYYEMKKFPETGNEPTNPVVKDGLRALKASNQTESYDVETNIQPVSRRDPERLKAGMIIHELLANLTLREQIVLRERYGLFGVKPKSLVMIGKRLRFSRGRIHQIEKEALKKLRKKLRNGKTIY